MTKRKQRRRSRRETPKKPEIAILYPKAARKGGQLAAAGGKQDTLLVHVINRSESGLLLESSFPFEQGSALDMRLRFPDEKSWMAYTGDVVWTDTSPDKPSCYRLGVEIQQAITLDEVPPRAEARSEMRMFPSDLEFLTKTQLLDVIPEEARCHFLNCMTPKHLEAGERFIAQGDEGDSLYIIQEGTCVVSIEKDGVSHPINRLKTGDIVGEMALLTGERRTANVDAETGMILWGLTRKDFDALCQNYPDLIDFLTELITHRLSTEKVTAERTVGKYLINEILGIGGWSIVYRGTHASLNMPVAIKMLKHSMATNAEFFQKFKNEAKTIANLNHESIVKVYDIEELYRTIFIIMEYLEGLSLDYVLGKTPKLPLPRVVDIVLQVCAGLAYAHENGIVHQDIKPANIFLLADDRAKIVDFGISCPPGSVDCFLPGTVYYMSPEQIEGDSVDARTDIYSLGIMTYEMITGQRPYPEGDIYELMRAHVHEDVPDPRELVPDLPNELTYFVKRATQRDPAGRFRTVWEIMRDLQPFADEMGVERKTLVREPRKMMSLFLFYQGEQQLTLNRLVEAFSNQVRQIGAELRAADFKDV